MDRSERRPYQLDMTVPPWLWRSCLVLLLVVPVLGAAAPAVAAPVLRGSVPSDGAVLESTPDTVVVQFDQAVAVAPDSLIVLDARGRRVDRGPAVQPGGDRTVVSVPVDAARRGPHGVAWRVAPAAGGDPVVGAFAFQVGEENAGLLALLPVVDSRGPAAALALPGFRLVALVGLFVLIGTAAVGAVRDRPALARRPVRRLLWAAWAVSTAATVAAAVLLATAPRPGTTAPGSSYPPELLLLLLQAMLLLAALPGLLLLTRPTRSGSGSTVATAGALDDGPARPGSPPPTPPPPASEEARTSVPAVSDEARTPPPPASEDVRTSVPAELGAALTGGILLVVAALGVAPSAAPAVVLGVLAALVALTAWCGVAVLAMTAGARPALVPRRVPVAAAGVLAGLSLTVAWPAVERLTGGSPVTVPDVLVFVQAGCAVGLLAVTLRAGDLGLRVRTLSGGVLSLALVAVFVLQGGGSAAGDLGPVAPGAPSGGAFGATLRPGSTAVLVSADPARAGRNELHYTVLGPDGQLLDAELTSSLYLPEHDFGPLQVDLQRVGPGHYLTYDLIIPSAGAWELQVAVTPPGDDGPVRSATPVTVR